MNLLQLFGTKFLRFPSISGTKKLGLQENFLMQLVFFVIPKKPRSDLPWSWHSLYSKSHKVKFIHLSLKGKLCNWVELTNSKFINFSSCIRFLIVRRYPNLLSILVFLDIQTDNFQKLTASRNNSIENLLLVKKNLKHKSLNSFIPSERW